MSVPLPPRNAGFNQRQINRGLYFSKFFDLWKPDFDDIVPASVDPQKNAYHSGKMSWVLAQFREPRPSGGVYRTDARTGGKTFPCGDAGEIKAAIDRLRALAKAIKGEAKTYVTMGRLVTGTGIEHPIENGMLFHHTLGIPYLPGSSIKGMMHAYARLWAGGATSEIDRLFGPVNAKDVPEGVGSVIVFDALPIQPVQLVAEIITPHIGEWRLSARPEEHQPGDWVSPNPIPFLAVKENTEFLFAIAPRGNGEPEDVGRALTLLSEALDWVGAGAKTAIGFGRMEDPAERDALREAELAAQRARDDIERQRIEAEREAARVAAAAWIPKVGDIAARKIPGEPLELVEIRAVRADGDYDAAYRGKRDTFIVERQELTFRAASWAEAGSP